MNRLFELAEDLAANQTAKTDLAIRLSRQRTDLEARKLALIPAEGWPGKNAEERKINEQRTYAADEPCQKIKEEINSLEEEILQLDNIVQTYVDERRAIEWQIRAALVEAITGNVITTRRGHRHVEDTAFDDYTDEVADARLTEKFGENGHFDEPFPPEDDPLHVGPPPIPAWELDEENIPF